MNKQEAIKRIKLLKARETFMSETIWVKQDDVIGIIHQIHEPQKVVVPKFVAEWYDHAKQQNFTLRSALEHWSMSEELEKWFQYSYNQETFARAWLDGYEIEQEKLYTVEIPNPNIEKHHVTVLKRMEEGNIELCIFVRPDLTEAKFHLTEAEIKEDFEWAWQFAKEVE